MTGWLLLASAAAVAGTELWRRRVKVVRPGWQVKARRLGLEHRTLGLLDPRAELTGQVGGHGVRAVLRPTGTHGGSAHISVVPSRPLPHGLWVERIWLAEGPDDRRHGGLDLGPLTDDGRVRVRASHTAAAMVLLDQPDICRALRGFVDTRRGNEVKGGLVVSWSRSGAEELTRDVLAATRMATELVEGTWAPWAALAAHLGLDDLSEPDTVILRGEHGGRQTSIAAHPCAELPQAVVGMHAGPAVPPELSIEKSAAAQGVPTGDPVLDQALTVGGVDAPTVRALFASPQAKDAGLRSMLLECVHGAGACLASGQLTATVDDATPARVLAVVATCRAALAALEHACEHQGPEAPSALSPSPHPDPGNSP